jgi:hypothetical protein
MFQGNTVTRLSVPVRKKKYVLFETFVITTELQCYFVQHQATGHPLTAPGTFAISGKFLFFDATQLDKKVMSSL